MRRLRTGYQGGGAVEEEDVTRPPWVPGSNSYPQPDDDESDKTEAAQIDKLEEEDALKPREFQQLRSYEGAPGGGLFGGAAQIGRELQRNESEQPFHGRREAIQQYMEGRLRRAPNEDRWTSDDVSDEEYRRATEQQTSQKFQRGGPVRKRVRRRPVKFLRRFRPLRRRPTGYAVGGTVTADQGVSAASSAASGTNVNNPVMISAALDARSKNPAHYTEDAPLLATRPAGAPVVPDETTGYARGGEVKRQGRGPRGDTEAKYIRKWTKGPKTGYLKNVSYFPVGYENKGYQEGGEVEDDEPVQEVQPESQPVAEQPPEPPPDQPPQPPPDQPPEPAPELPRQPPPPDQPPERELSRQTGYQQVTPEQPSEPPPNQTGYNQQPADDQSVLSRALDWLHNTFGLGGAKTPNEPAVPAEPAARRVREALGSAIGLHGREAQLAGRTPQTSQEPLVDLGAWAGRSYGLPGMINRLGEAGEQASAAQREQDLKTEELRQAGETAALGQIGRGINQGMRNVAGFIGGIEPKELPAAPPPKLDPSYLTSSAAPPAAPAAAPAATPATVGVGDTAAPAPNVGGVTPEQQAIRDYMSGKGGYTPMQMTEIINNATKGDQTFDVGGAILKGFQSLQTDDEKGKFIQALKPSYENVFAAMTTLARQGKHVEAMQLAEKLDNLIPNGNNLKFTSDNNGAIAATIQSGSGSRTFVMTPQQFQAYTEATGPLAAYDLAAKRGTEGNLLAVGAQQAGGRATGYAAGGRQPAGGPTIAVSGRGETIDGQPLTVGGQQPAGGSAAVVAPAGPGAGTRMPASPSAATVGGPGAPAGPGHIYKSDNIPGITKPGETYVPPGAVYVPTLPGVTPADAYKPPQLGGISTTPLPPRGAGGSTGYTRGETGMVPFRQGQPLGAAEANQFTRPLAPGERRQEPNFLPGGQTGGRAGQQVPGGTIAPRPGEPGFVYPQDRANWDKLPPAQQDYNIKHIAYNQFPNDAAKQQQAEARIRQQIQLQKNTETYRSSTAERAENRQLTRDKFTALTQHRDETAMLKVYGAANAAALRAIAAKLRNDPAATLEPREQELIDGMYQHASNNGIIQRIEQRQQQPNAASPTGPAATATTGQTTNPPVVQPGLTQQAPTQPARPGYKWQRSNLGNYREVPIQ
jgi:hypothetical protein